jgi:hypothetical protein
MVLRYNSKNDSCAREGHRACNFGATLFVKFILRQHSGMLLQDNIVYRSPVVVVKECGRTLGVAVQQMSRGMAVGQSWQQLIYGNRRVPQVLHDTWTKRRQGEWEPDYDDGDGR